MAKGKDRLMETSMENLESEYTKFLETRTTKIFLFQNNIVLSEEQGGTFTTIDDAIRTAECVNKIHAADHWGIIVDITKNKGISKEARDYYALATVFPGRVGIALLVESYFSKVLANFFTGFSKPLIPTQLFTSKKEAFEWLTGLINDAKQY
jgi:hypothetical protein